MTRRQVILVLPPGARGAIGDAELQRWLSQGRVGFREPDEDVLCRVARFLGHPVAAEGLAALRFWGQAGERPSAWIAAADPVHLETRLRELRVRALRPGDIDLREHDALIERLQAQIGGEEHAFIRLGGSSYLRARSAFVAPGVSPAVADGHVPDRFLPSGPGAADFHRLASEVQMLLHEHEVNAARAARGAPVINALWIWGGGTAPLATDANLPPLFSTDPLFTGFWASARSPAAAWQGNIGRCLEEAADRFVAVLPAVPRDDAADALQQVLTGLRKRMRTGEIRSSVLFFRDGLSISIGSLDRLRFWRGIDPNLQAPQ